MAAVDLVYVAPPSCPSRATIESEIAGYVAKATGSVRAEIRIELRDSTAHATVATEVTGAKGERSLEASTCEDVAHAAALVVGLAVDPSIAAAPAPAAASAPAAAAASAPAPAAAAAPAPARAAARAAASGGQPRAYARGPFVSAGGGVDGSALPGVAGGFAARVGTDLPGLGLGLGFLYLPSRRATLEGRDAGGTFSLLAGSASACANLWRFVAPCAGFELGRLGAAGFGVRTTRNDSVLWSAALLGGAGTLPGRPIGARFEAWIVIPTGRPDFLLEGVGVVHTPRVGVRATLSLELTIR